MANVAPDVKLVSSPRLTGKHYFNAPNASWSIASGEWASRESILITFFIK